MDQARHRRIEAGAEDLDGIVAHANDPDALRAAIERDHRAEKPYSFLVAADLSSVQSFDPYYPESPQWVAGSPFVEIKQGPPSPGGPPRRSQRALLRRYPPFGAGSAAFARAHPSPPRRV